MSARTMFVLHVALIRNRSLFIRSRIYLRGITFLI